MRRFYLFFITIVVVGCVSCEKGNMDNPTEFTTCVDYPEPPIEIMSNTDESSTEFDCRLINYFNIIQVKKNLFYMYYAAFGICSGEADIDQGLFFAYSNDAIHWKREKPNGSRNLILENGIQEQSVFMLNSDLEYPFRLVANIKENGKFKLCMWKSKNGYDFDFSDKKVLLEDRLHDTQNVVIPRGDSMYLYTRLWNETATNRRNGVAKYNLDGEMLSPIDTLAGDYVYNSAASYVNEKYDLLQPTYMNNKEGDSKSDDAYFQAYLASSENSCIEIDTNLNQWLKSDEKWRIVAPGILDIDGQKYIAYYTWTWSHDAKQPERGLSRYYLIKMNLYVNGEKLL